MTFTLVSPNYRGRDSLGIDVTFLPRGGDARRPGRLGDAAGVEPTPDPTLEAYRSRRGGRNHSPRQ